jgi:redox-sensing transcriptional repressor
VKNITKYATKNSLKRLSLYKICLDRMKKMGIKRVFSYSLGPEAGVKPEQVRKDFSEFKIRGNQRAGYDIDKLIASMESIFQHTEMFNIIIVGMGNIGQALANYKWLNQKNINIVATFDIDPSKQRKKTETVIYPLSRLNEIILRFNVKVAIIAVPEISAQEACNHLVEAGIKGIVNFAPVILKVPSDIVVSNVNLYDEVESVFFWVESENKHNKIKELPEGPAVFVKQSQRK